MAGYQKSLRANQSGHLLKQYECILRWFIMHALWNYYETVNV